MRTLLVLAVLLLQIGPSTTFAVAAETGPSRKPVERCAWEKLADAKLGLEAWVQRCDFGFRQIDFVVRGDSLEQRWSDGGDPEPVVDVLPLEKGEAPEAGVERVFRARTEAAVAKRCVRAPAPSLGAGAAPAGAKRYTFVPDPEYAKELAAKANPDEVPEPPCGDLGASADGIRYFEVQPASTAGKILFVRVGQEEPLFDEQTLHLIAPAAER